MNIVDIFIFSAIAALGLFLVIKPSYLYVRFTPPEERNEESLENTKYARWGGFMLLFYVGLQVLGWLAG